MYYSQHGEDYLLEKIFTDKEQGYFVEVGCIDGLRFSNTAHFEEMGWRGLMVEAQTEYIPQLKSNRPSSTVVHAAATDKDEGEVTFFADPGGGLSTLLGDRESDMHKHYADTFSGFSTQTVPARTLTSIFTEHAVPQIDFLSLDIEGAELMALAGLDLHQYRPTVLVIEYNSIKHLGQLWRRVKKYGYCLQCFVNNNAFFTTETERFIGVLGRKYGPVTLLHKGDTSKSQPDKQRSYYVDVRRKAFYKRLLSRLKWDIVNLFKS